MVDYSKAKIYKITSKKTEKIYIGATTQLLTVRLAEHKSRAKLRPKSYKSSIIFKIDPDASIELLEDVPCESKDELSVHEGNYIRRFKDCCVNKVITNRSRKEYKADNLEAITLYQKEYHIINREKIALQQKKYNEKNKEKHAIRSKKYREKNKERLAKRVAEKIKCDNCGRMTARGNISPHKKTNVCKSFSQQS